MTDPNYTHIMVLLDRSGSMSPIRQDMQGGFDSFIAEQRKIEGACTVTLARFNTEYERVYEAKPLAFVPPLQLEPRGNTALHDALCRLIDEEGAWLSRMPESRRPGKVLCVVISDGEENSSRLYSARDVQRRIEVQRVQFNWTFVFMGTSEEQQDHARRSLGIGVTRGYVPSAIGVNNLYSGLSNSVTEYRSSGKFQ